MASEKTHKPKPQSTKKSAAAKAAEQETDTRTPSGRKLPY